jgi:hypothetical protein
MPQSLHGGPGRAGGGEELGGLRALNFYHRRSAMQASTAVLGNCMGTHHNSTTQAACRIQHHGDP